MKKTITLFIFTLFITSINCIEIDLNHYILSTTTLSDDHEFESSLLYRPELGLELFRHDNIVVDSEISYDFNLSCKNSELELSSKLYRSWLRCSSSQTELRVGLQKINFGPAQILRSLQWFDSINPKDISQTTEGVKALLGRYYFVNNANIWLWGVWGNRNETSFDKFFHEEDNLEFGGRIQYPFQYCEAGFSVHHSPTVLQSFDNETKYGIDLRWDMTLGFWIESCLNVYNRLEQNNYSRLLSLGTDYTFGIGNGIYSLFEHQYFSEVQEDIWKPTDRSGASSLLISYPLGMFDSVRSILTYNWQPELYNWFLSYNRNYDYLSIYLNLFWNSDQNNSQNIDKESGASVQLMLETKF
ncbi:MAG: hypothetical protein P9L95_01785 [Candidatus Tenebribacter mawsonii]|nr:hypothetical protein [Candidatus Tenebribacter mawsonii]